MPIGVAKKTMLLLGALLLAALTAGLLVLVEPTASAQMGTWDGRSQWCNRLSKVERDLRWPICFFEGKG
jgi:hypothetical protein